MDKLEIGEYTRTSYGVIGKFIPEYKVLDRLEKLGVYKYENGILEINGLKMKIEKHSKDIIDLIKVGDIVNNHFVKAIYLDGATKYIKLDNAYSKENNNSGIRTYNEDIKTIMTKEIYEDELYNIEYNDTNEYCKTNIGRICKYKKDIENVVKHSKNIIDLVEIGDIVNGEKVIDIFNSKFLSFGELPYIMTENNKYEEQDIKTILTKEILGNKLFLYRVR